MTEKKRSTITVGGQTWVGPEEPELKEDETAFEVNMAAVSAFCPRCGKHLWASMVDDAEQPVGKVRLPEHTETECDHKVVDDVHDL